MTAATYFQSLRCNTLQWCLHYEWLSDRTISLINHSDSECPNRGITATVKGRILQNGTESWHDVWFGDGGANQIAGGRAEDVTLEKSLERQG